MAISDPALKILASAIKKTHGLLLSAPANIRNVLYFCNFCRILWHQYHSFHCHIPPAQLLPGADQLRPRWVLAVAWDFPSNGLQISLLMTWTAKIVVWFEYNTLETLTVNEILNLFITYGYETWEWKEGIRGYSYPLLFALMYKLLYLMNYDTAYLLVRLQCIILTASVMFP